MGSIVLRHFLARETEDLVVCDLVHDLPAPQPVPRGCRHTVSCEGCFTDTCLARGGVIVATTVGDELEASRWWLLPRGTVLFLAHNLALPRGERGVLLARSLAENGVLLIPGQVLTLGGALTARLEWFWRQIPEKPAFDKGLAHEVVRRVVSHLTAAMLGLAKSASVTPYDAMLRLAD
jgi:hypothetical protein